MYNVQIRPLRHSAGSVVGRHEYSAFGMPLASAGSYAPRFGFSSKERDASGLVYYGFRFHAPELCRWITPDPIREDGGLNLYRFCGNDPVNFVDPPGFLAANVAAGLIGAGIGGFFGGVFGGFDGCGGWNWAGAGRGLLAGLIGGGISGFTFGAASAAGFTVGWGGLFVGAGTGALGGGGLWPNR